MLWRMLYLPELLLPNSTVMSERPRPSAASQHLKFRSVSRLIIATLRCVWAKTGTRWVSDLLTGCRRLPSETPLWDQTFRRGAIVTGGAVRRNAQLQAIGCHSQ